MGNDSGIRQKNKQRTAPHKKHTVFPGIRINTNDVKVDAGSIKPLSRPSQTLPQASKKPVERGEPEWVAYDKATKDLNSFDNTSASRSNGIEQKYVLAYKRLVRAGLAPQLKRKYRT